MDKIYVPREYNYVAAFLSFACQLRCTYCINHHGGNLLKKRWMSGEDWVKGINRLYFPTEDIPLTFQGGEPTVHKDFYYIVNNIRKDMPLDLLTNLEFDIDKFMKEVHPDRFKRDAPYASIRVSYHHGQSNFWKLIEKVKIMQDAGYSIGVWEIDHPEYSQDCKDRQECARGVGIDYRLKEFLGPYNGVNYGKMRYPDAVNSKFLRKCMCKTSELLIDPVGNVFRCHSDLYANRYPISNILKDKVNDKLNMYLPCSYYGKCNSCDIKITTNRFQEDGHTSVDIKEIGYQHRINDEYVEEVVNTYGKQG